MKIITGILIGIISLLGFTKLSAQEMGSPVMQEIGLQFGWRFNRIMDQRYAQKAKKMGQPIYGMYYRKENDRKREELQFSFSRTPDKKELDFLSFKTIMPQVSYSHQRKVGNIWLGGFIESFTLLNFAQSTTNVFGNNAISYTFTGNIGPMIGYEHFLQENDNNRISFNSSARVSVLSRVVRPAFGHPYPEKYLSEEHFSPTRAGMAGPLLRSAKYRTLNKYQMFRLVLGLNYYHKGKIKLAIQYEFSGQNNRSEVDRSRALMQDLIFGASYLY